MADFYKVLKADPLGEPWTPSQPGAKPIQNYWCQVEGMDEAVSIGRQTDNPLRPGVHVYGDLAYAKSQKGTVYFKFKSAKVPEGVTRPTDDPGTPAQATAQAATGAGAYAENWADKNASGVVPGWFIPYGNMIEYVYKELKGMDIKEQQEEAPVQAVEQVGGEPLAPETKDMLDGIFGTEEPLPAEPEEDK